MLETIQRPNSGNGEGEKMLIMFVASEQAFKFECFYKIQQGQCAQTWGEKVMAKFE